MNPGETQASKAYEQLRGKLLAGDFVPGQRLVNRVLANEFGVSVIPVREAIFQLASEGLINVIPGSGAFVRAPDAEELEELAAFRIWIESGAAAEAARKITKGELESLDRFLEEWDTIAAAIAERSDRHASEEQIKRWMELEEAFHTTILEASHNRFLIGASKDHQVLSRFFQAKSDLLSIEAEHARNTCEGHRRIIKVLREGDPELARMEMSQHLDGMNG